MSTAVQPIRTGRARFKTPSSGASKRAPWLIPSDAPTKPDDLTFFGRDAKGLANWWSVTLPRTSYWHAHQVLGRAYAFELLDLINNPQAEFPEHILAYIVAAQARSSEPDPCGGAVVFGFHEVLSEYLATGTASR